MAVAQVSLWVVVLLLALAIAFDFMNGFHDAANSIATVVSTGVLKPGQAVVFAAFFNLIAIFIFHLSVAATVGKGIANPGVVDVHVVFGALIGAITWNLVTWYYGIPSSSSHALIGGIVGAVAGRQISKETGGSKGNKNVSAVAGAAAGALAGNAIQNNVTSDSFDVQVRMDDGRVIVVNQRDLAGVRENAYVRVVNGKVVLR